MKKKMGMRMLAAMLAASMVISASSGMVSAKGVGVSATGDVSDASSVSETRAAQYSGSAKSVSVEGAALDVQKVPTGLSGAGTESSPYMIGSLKDLLLMNRYINFESSNAKHFALSADIDLSGARFYQFSNSDGVFSLVSAKATLSGNANVRFDLDGRNHKLYGMNLAVPNGKTTAAVFGVINANSAVRNLVLEDCTIRVNHESDGAFAVLAVQNFGTLQNITMNDCVLDARVGVCKENSNAQSYLSDLASGRVYLGAALAVADNAGKVYNFTVKGTDANKGVFVKGGRSFVGLIAGQNRGEIADVRIAGMRIVSIGSEDSDAVVSGKGDVAASIGFVAGKNFGKNGNSAAAVVRSATVDLQHGSDLMYGHRAGGIAGLNDGVISDCAVRGAKTADAHLYGVGVYGGISGTNTGSITGSGNYNVDFQFARKDSGNAYGGIAGENSGTITDCIASGSAGNSADSAASVGGVIGNVKSGTSISGNYALVAVSVRGDNCGAVVGKDGSAAYVGQTNYWSSAVSGLLGAAPGLTGTDGDLICATPVVHVSAGKGATTVSASALEHRWSGSKAVLCADLSDPVSSTTSSIRVSASGSSVKLSSSEAGTFGDLQYSVSLSAPAGVSGEQATARVSVPVYVTESAGNGAGTSAKNPIVLTSYSQLKMMKYAPDAHYSLGADITLGDDWTPVAFSGTLDGNGHTLYISMPLFSSVQGSRDDRVTNDHWKSLSNNLTSGYIYELKLVPVSRVDGGVFGTVSNATLRDIQYAASTEYEDGFVLLSASRGGALIDTLSGNDFLYRCSVSVPIAVTAMKSDGIAALAGCVTADHLLAEQCSVSSLVSLDKNLGKVGGLFGDMSAVRGSAKLVSCTAAGCVYVTAPVKDVLAKIMIGAAGSTVTAEGCSYRAASVSGCSAADSAAPFTAGIREIKDAPKTDGSKSAAAEIIIPEVLEEDNLDTASFNDFELDPYTENGNTVYRLQSKADMENLSGLLADVATARTAIYELCADIDMQGDTLMMSDSAATAFEGTFRGATKSGGGKYTIYNFTISATNGAAGMFCYANGATFDNFGLGVSGASESVTATSTQSGLAILVGFADYGMGSGSATHCSFTNIDITNCLVNSSVYATTASLTNVSQAGALVGCLWSTSTGSIYTFDHITVKDTTVKNDNSYGAWAIGGLIGDSRCTSGTVCIGGTGARSIVMEHVTVRGHCWVGGILGKAGNVMPSTCANATTGITSPSDSSGILVQNAVVCGNANGDSLISAGTGTGNGGCAGGIVACETVSIGNSSITGCTVSDTSVLSNNNAGTITNYYTETGGIAGHFSGTVQNCTVEDCTITSCTPGGIVGRSSRKAASDVGTQLQITNCKVIGETTINTPSGIASNVCEGGGILSGGRFAKIVVEQCGVGPDVSVSGKFLYFGGIVGYSGSNTASYWSTTISNCVSYASVNIDQALDKSAVGGVIGYTYMGANKLKISDCVVGGMLDLVATASTGQSAGGYVGGVIGWMNNNTNSAGIIKDCTVLASLNSRIQNPVSEKSGKLIGNVYAAAAGILTQANLQTALSGNVVSSEPALDDCSYIGCYGATAALAGTSFNTLTRTFTSVTDINRPTRNVSDPEQSSTFPYIHNSTDPVEIDGDVNAVVSVTPTNVASVARLASYNHTDASVPMYGGWTSTSNNIVAVKDTSTTSTVVIEGKKSDSAGVRCAYTVACSAGAGTAVSDASGLFLIPGTDEVALIHALIPVTCVNIAGVTLSGTGTASDPFLIHNLEELDSLRTRDLSLSEYYAIANDILIDPAVFENGGDFYKDGSFFQPIIGKNDTVFNGTLTGAYDTANAQIDSTGAVMHTISGLQIGGSVANTGLFAQTNGATIKNIEFCGAVISSSGSKVGLVVGDANNTTFDKIHITPLQTEDPDSNEITTTNTTVSGTNTVYAGTLAAYAVDARVTNTVISGVSVSGAYFTGGLFGHAHASGTANRENSIKGTTITNLTVSSLETTYDGKVDIAAGIAAEFAGTLGDTGSANATTISGTGSITGSVASGLVGLVDETGDGVCSIQNASISGTYSITSSRSVLAQAAAAGVVGKVRKDNSDDGTATPAVDLDIADCTIGSGVTITAQYYAGGVVGSSGLVNGSIDINDCQTQAVVQASAAVGALAGRVYDLDGLHMDDCTAGGSLTITGSTPQATQGAIGGVIGLAENHAKSSAGALVSDTLITAAQGSAATHGVIIGSVTTSVLPTNLANSPFDHVYYSSYQLGVLSERKDSITPYHLCGDGAVTETYTAYQATCFDMQEQITYKAGTSEYVKSLPLTAEPLQLASDSIHLPAAFTDDDPSDGKYLFESFLAPTSVSGDTYSFVLDSIYAENQSESLFTYDPSTRTFTLVDSGEDPAVFEYQNGIKVCFFVNASNIKGQGTSSDPFLIEEIGHLKFVMRHPSSYFILARDLDFSQDAGEAGPAWAAAWDVQEASGAAQVTNDWVHTLMTTPFSGHLDGNFYEDYDENDTTNSTYPGYYGNMVHHSIKNLNITSDADLVGFFPKLASGASVQNLTFSGCSFTSTAAISGGSAGNAGVLVGENAATTVSGIKVESSTVSANGHAGAIAGVSFGTISDCLVDSGTSVTSQHCAGGIVGGGASVTNCRVQGACVITGTQFAGGIIGGTMNLGTTAQGGEWPNNSGYTAQRDALGDAVISGCSVTGSTVQTAATTTASRAGGILGCAEYGDSDYRTIVITNCTVDAVDTPAANRSSVTANVDNTVAQKQQNTAGGILGYMQPYYKGLEISNCQSYANVRVYGSAVEDYQTHTAAGAIFGGSQGHQEYLVYDNGALAFRIVNNVGSGAVYSPMFAGGIAGEVQFLPVSYKIPNLSGTPTASDAFMSGNIVSCTFEQTAAQRTSGTTDTIVGNLKYFGILFGQVYTQLFAEGATAENIEKRIYDNYFSSDVSNTGNGNASIGAYGSADGITACILYDVAEGLNPDNAEVPPSSFTVGNNYPESGYTFDEEMIGKSADDTYPATIDKPVRLIFNQVSITKSGNTASVDFASSSGTNTLVVWSGAAAAQQHTLSLGLHVTPATSAYYSASVSGSAIDGQKAVSLSIAKDPSHAKNHKLIANLGYGLLVDIPLSSGSTEDGSIQFPFTIPDAETFADYFFGVSAADASFTYLGNHYKQTADISFADILTEIGKLDSSTARSTHFSPIGSSASGGSFYGGYDGGGYRIYDFRYSTKDNSADSSIEDVGLFGYVGDADAETPTGDYRLRNLHIELSSGVYGLDGTTSTASATAANAYDLASVCGGTNTGGLVGRYESNLPIKNCSVVYGCVRSDHYAGGLVGSVLYGDLVNCFTSTMVRVYDDLNTVEIPVSVALETYCAGGLIGVQATNSLASTVFDNCFSSSDILAPRFASGFLGHVNSQRFVELNNCACTATTTCFAKVTQGAQQNVEYDDFGTPLVIGHKGDPGTTPTNVGYVTATNVFVGGVNATEYANLGSGTTVSQKYPTLFGDAVLRDGSGNIFFDAETIGRITIPNGTSTPSILRANGALYDGWDTSTATPAANQGWVASAGKTTADLIDADFDGFSQDTVNWSYTEGLYPVLRMKVAGQGETVDAYDAFSTSQDPYYTAFSKFAALPVFVDEREADDVEASRTYFGITYPTYLPTSFAGESNVAISVASSTYSAGSNNGVYSSSYDYKLVGNGTVTAGVVHGNTDMDTDLLFNTHTADKTFILRNTYLDFGTWQNDVTRNLKSPYILASAPLMTFPRTVTVVTETEVDGETQTVETEQTINEPIFRQIRIGLRGSKNTVYIATERQLRALSSADTGKFAPLSSAVSTNKNIRLCADIEMRPAPTGSETDQRVSFTPIANYKGGSGDSSEGAFSFDGCNCSIDNLYIDTVNDGISSNETNTGLFSVLGGTGAGDSLRISNLILRNVDITGGDSTGALIGKGDKHSKVDNCMVIGGTVTGGDQTGGMIGSIPVDGDGSTQSLNRLAVVGVDVTGTTSNASSMGVGLLAGSLSKVSVDNVYTVGTVTSNSNYVGGLAGNVNNVTASGIVTSGYVRTTLPAGKAGGVFGTMLGASTLTNAESTAFIKGGDGAVLGGIVGNRSAGTIASVVFAGSLSSMSASGTGARSTICGSGTMGVSTAIYDTSLNTTSLSLDSAYTGLTTDQIISGSGYSLDSNWTFDTANEYYPNPVSLASVKAKDSPDSLDHVISDEFKAGLCFALARIDFSYAGSTGTADYYTQISALSPVGENANDTVALVSTGYVTNTPDKPYLVNPQSGSTTVANQLVSNAFEKDKMADVRAELSTASGATFEGVPASSIYRYLEVPVVRTVQVTYEIGYAQGLTATGADSIGLSLITDRNGTKYASNAVTSQSQDVNNGNSVQFEKLLCQSGITVNTILPDGYKATYSVPTNNTAHTTSGAVWDSTNNCIDISGVSDNYSDTVNVRLIVTISKDPSWGLRDLTGAALS